MHLVAGKASSAQWYSLAHQRHNPLDRLLAFGRQMRRVWCNHSNRFAAPRDHDRVAALCFLQDARERLVGLASGDRAHGILLSDSAEHYIDGKLLYRKAAARQYLRQLR